MIFIRRTDLNFALLDVEELLAIEASTLHGIPLSGLAARAMDCTYSAQGPGVLLSCSV
jgi:hypothetical protein